MIITTKMLLANNACSEQVKLFRRLFGDGGTVTLKRCLRAANHELQIEGAIDLLTESQQKFYYDNYEKVSNLVERMLPFWYYFDSSRRFKQIENEIHRDQYNLAQEKARRRALAHLFFAASQFTGPIK